MDSSTKDVMQYVVSNIKEPAKPVYHLPKNNTEEARLVHSFAHAMNVSVKTREKRASRKKLRTAQ